MATATDAVGNANYRSRSLGFSQAGVACTHILIDSAFEAVVIGFQVGEFPAEANFLVGQILASGLNLFECGGGGLGDLLHGAGGDLGLLHQFELLVIEA